MLFELQNLKVEYYGNSVILTDEKCDEKTFLGILLYTGLS